MPCFVKTDFLQDGDVLGGDHSRVQFRQALVGLLDMSEHHRQFVTVGRLPLDPLPLEQLGLLGLASSKLLLLLGDLLSQLGAPTFQLGDT